MEIINIGDEDCFVKNIPQPPSQIHNTHNSESEVTSSARNLPECCEFDKAGEDRSERNNLHPSKFIITTIKPAVKNSHRANIFINDKYDFSLDLAQLTDFKLKVGQHLTEQQLAEYRHASEFGKLYQRTLEWVLTRPHSVKETRDYLVRKQHRRQQENRQRTYNKEKPRDLRQQFHLKTKPLPLITDDDITQVLQRLIAKGYLNDVNFTTFYIENRFVKKGISHQRLRQELLKKGIDKEIIDQCLATAPRDERTEICKIIAKKRTKYSDDQKLIQYLLRQGFNYHLIQEALADN